MRKSLLYFVFLISSVLSTTIYAQQNTYEWSWAKRGGGGRVISSNSKDNTQRVHSIDVDRNNNYYFLSQIGGENLQGSIPTFGNVPNDTIVINDYSESTDVYSYQKKRDTYLVSTNCQGDFRWQKTIGGSGDVYAYGMGVDSLGGVYVAGNSWNISSSPTGSVPLHYDQDTIRNTLTPDKNIFLIKYDSIGNYEWLREPQPFDSDPNWGYASSGEIFVEEDGTVHWMVILDPGSTLENGAITAEDNYLSVSNSQVGDVGVIKYDKDGNFLGYVRLNIDMDNHIGMRTTSKIDFNYNKASNTYYLAVSSRFGDDLYHPAIINNTEITGAYFVAAFNSTTGNAEWWQEFSEDWGGTIRDIVIDKNGDIYITGYFAALLENGQIAGYPSFAGLTFGGYLKETFCMKLNATNGQGIWVSYSDGSCAEGESLAVNEDGVFLGQGYCTLGGGGHYWGNAYFTRPSGHGQDPVVIQLDKNTGDAIKIHDIMGAGYGEDDEITAITTDKLGNILVGGYMKSSHIFDNHSVVPQLDKKVTHPSDFFIAQLGKDGVSCSDPILTVAESEKLAIKLWPNPTQGRIHIESESFINSINIYNVLGQKADVSLDNTSTANGQMIDISSLSSGIYFIEIQSGKQREIKKIIKE